jgi:predicted nucleic acid-binding protein
VSGKPVVYWDASAFIALLKGEDSHGEDVARALLSQAGSFDRGEIIIATSMIGIGEVIAANLGDDVTDRFEQMIRRKNFLPVAVNESIARDAARLRSHCHKLAKSQANGDPYLLTMPDAIHVATAMRIRADVLVTTDTKDKPVNIKRRELGMTQVAKYYPVPDLHPVPIQIPALGLPGTGLL